MRSLILFASILLPYLSLAQNGGGGGTNNNSPGFYNPSTVPVVYTGTATGSIIVPGRMLMRVNTDNLVLKFDNWEELANGKVYPGYLFLDIISNVPWVVKVRSLDPFLISSVSNTATNTPCSLVSLKPEGFTEFIPLSTTPVTLLPNTTTDLETHYAVDVKLNNTWTSTGGSYNLNLAFTISNP